VKLNNTVKCIECGMMEDKKLASDYGKEIIYALEKQR
jgi:exosome complex RNA-binding protein Csl4